MDGIYGFKPIQGAAYTEKEVDKAPVLNVS